MQGTDHKKTIEDAIQSYLKKNPSTPTGLYQPIEYMLSLGGKRTRPALALMGCELFDGNSQEVLPAALAIELFHNFTLMHDDIMDNAPLRRNKSTVHKKWDQNTAILSGDVMLVHVYSLLERIKTEKFPAVFSIFNRTASQVCEGQQLDMDFEKEKQVSIGQYLHMIELKTAVLLGASLEIGAILANASEDDAKRLFEFGKELGIAFQLQDDMLDVYGDEKKFGKQKGGDIIDNKKTFLLIRALELSTAYQKEELLNWMMAGERDGAEKIIAVTALYESLNIRDHAKKEMDAHFEKALKSLAGITLPETKKAPLRKLAQALMNREN